MIINLKVSKEQKRALFLRYPDIKTFLESMIFKTAEKIITEQMNLDVEKELKEYHDRREANNNNVHGRKCNQATKERIRKSLKKYYAQFAGQEFHLFPETKRLISIANTGKVLSQETKDAIGRGNRGKVRTEEQRQNISKAKTGQKYKKRGIRVK